MNERIGRWDGGTMLKIAKATEIIEWLCQELGCEADDAKEFAQIFIGLLQASGGVSIKERPTMKELRYALGQALTLIYLLEEGKPPENIHQIKQEIRAAAEGHIATTTPDATIGGYQPTHGELDPSNPPRGGSGVPPKVLVVKME